MHSDREGVNLATTGTPENPAVKQLIGEDSSFAGRFSWSDPEGYEQKTA